MMSVNEPKFFARNYLRFLNNQLRKEYGVSLKFHELIDEYSSIESLAGFMNDRIEEQEYEPPFGL